MEKPLLSWIDEQAGINAFLTGEVDSLPLGNPIGVTTDSLRAQQDSLLMGLALLAREATVLGLQTEVAHDYCCQYLPIIENTTECTLPQVAHDLAWGLRRQVIAIRAGRYSLHVTQALRFVDQHIEAKLTVKMISEYTGISERHLGQLFKQEVGTTLSTYIAGQKIEAAKRMLRDGHATVAEIADTLGYANPSYFCSSFRKATQISPKQYQMQH
ncbi:helix-turn-helix domain-containing protein [Lacticaseibacillus porcinae]|uniref:helix-turn-helix domain-containing protein n=1 Tax=Lacticaseibacillus porcinae TaxID=1123687 RepID=UPI0013DD94A6|nr:helix-turn-helix domain-containing protein [Lacticaseibacillus porcinae]